MKFLDNKKQLEDYITLLNQKDRQLKYTRMIIFILVLFFSLSFYFIFKKDLFPKNPSYVIINLNQLSIHILDSLLHTADLTVLVPKSSDQQAYDTITSLRDYSKLVEDFMYQETVPENVESVFFPWIGSNQLNDKPLSKLPKFAFTIDGLRLEHQPLLFSIVGFQPDIDYHMDFGNGVIVRANEHLTYTYDRPGMYTISLTASTKHFVPSVFELDIQVLPDEKPSKDIQQNSLSEKKETSKKFSPEPNVIPIIKDLNTSNNQSQNAGSSLSSTTTPIVKQKFQEKKSVNKPEPETSVSDTPQISFNNLGPIRMPTYKEKDSGLKKFIEDNLIYPIDAINRNISGVVFVKALIDAEGNIKNAEIIQGLGYGCDAEALRLINKMGKWNPAIHEGKPIELSYIISIPFEPGK